jgi:hypothetical protein
MLEMGITDLWIGANDIHREGTMVWGHSMKEIGYNSQLTQSLDLFKENAYKSRLIVAIVQSHTRFPS